MRSDLERELASRQTLQLQIESKDQLVTSLKSQLEAKGAGHMLLGTGSTPFFYMYEYRY